MSSTDYGSVTEPTVVKSKDGRLYILKSPKRGGGEQIIFASPSEAVMFQRLLSEKLGIHMTVQEERVTDMLPGIPEGRAYCKAQDKRITTLEAEFESLIGFFRARGE